MIEEPVEPTHVGAHALVRCGLPHETDARSQHGQVRGGLEARGLQAQPLGVTHVVRVHAREQGPARRLAGGVERGHQSLAGIVQDAQARVAARRLLEDRPAAVRGVIVDGHHLVVGEGLRGQGGQAFPERRLRVADGEEDRHARERHSWRPTNSRASRRAMAGEAAATTKNGPAPPGRQLSRGARRISASQPWSPSTGSRIS